MSNILVGIGLRQPHYIDLLNTTPDIGWLEIHSENYTTLGGPAFEALLKLRENYPISMHCIGMSLGSADGLDQHHLQQIKDLADIIQPFLLSDHLSWSSVDNLFVPELMPNPYNDQSLKIFANNISQAQEYFGRELLFENPSTYFEFNNSTYTEPEFLNILAKKTGAKLLLDINNIYTSAQNNGWSAAEYINTLNENIVKELHLAGHSQKDVNGGVIYVDSHDNLISPDVWELYKKAIARFGQIHSLIEWDKDIPALEILLSEAKKAATIMSNEVKVLA
jgi:uncharacterized protein